MKLLNNLRNREQIYIIPTRIGFLYGITCIVMLMVGATYANNLIYLLSFMLIIIGMIGMIQTHNNIKGVVVENIEMFPAAENSEGQVVAIIRNQSKDSKLTLQLEVKRGASFAMNAQTTIASIEGKSSIRHVFALPTKQRGINKFRRIRLASVYPLGLCFSWKVFYIDIEQLVYPKPEGVLPFPNRHDRSGYREEHASIFGGDQMQNLRNYKDGDPKKFIHWKGLAKTDRLLTKEFFEGSDFDLNLRLEEIPIRHRENRLRQLTKWVIDAHQLRLTYAIDLGQNNTKKLNGSEHFRNCLHLLATYPKGEQYEPTG